MADSPDFGSFGRFVETPIDDMVPEMRDAYDFTMELRGQVPGPHRIWLSNAKLSKTIVPTGAYFQTESVLTKSEIEIVTNVINGRWLAAYSNYEHERIAETSGHLPSEKVEAMIAGLPTSFVDPRQQIVYELASTLAHPRVVPRGMYERAKALLGDAGIVDLTVLMGWFSSVSLTLMAYDVPSNALGLDQQTKNTKVGQHGLGGRVPLLEPQEMTTAQKATYDVMDETMVPWSETAGFVAKLKDGRMIGPFNGFLLSPEITASFLQLQNAEQKHTTLSERVREVVILTVGAVWKSDYERYAHSAVARKAGISEGTVEALVSGKSTIELDEKEQLAQRFIWKLTAEHQVGDELYAQDEASFGPQGIVDMIHLAGCYDTISSLLNTFRVPVPV